LSATAPSTGNAGILPASGLTEPEESAEEEGNELLYVDVGAFQGPLALLLSLIQKHKVDIYDIPLALIADRFVASLELMQVLDLEVTSEFLLMAAQLVYLKSRELLPKPRPPEELAEDERLKTDLVERLLVYRLYRETADFLRERDCEAGGHFLREVDVAGLRELFPPMNPVLGVEPEKLAQLFFDLLAKAEAETEMSETYMTVEEIPMAEMLTKLLRRLLLYPQGVLFEKLLRFRSRLEMIVAFLALLELLRSGRARVQTGGAGEIFVVPTADAADAVLRNCR
jgi:segregation and condensation protein A